MLNFPNKIKVGYQNRKDTYTGKLAFITWYDDKGKLRKETSWSNWCKEELGSDEYSNVPTEGFVINKNVGETRSHWNTRKAFIRIYDPRNFELEIDVGNLLFILEHNDCMKGGALLGNYVYGWDGAKLQLIPTNSKEYEERITFKFKRIAKKQLEEGCSYFLKEYGDTAKVVYLGYLQNWLENKEQHVFVDGEGIYHFLDKLTQLKHKYSTLPIDNYYEMFNEYLNETIYGSKIVSMELVESTGNTKFFEYNGEIYQQGWNWYGNNYANKVIGLYYHGKYLKTSENVILPIPTQFYSKVLIKFESGLEKTYGQ